MKRLLILAAASVCGLAPAATRAQELGNSGTLTVGAERLFGVVFSTTTVDSEVGGSDVSQSRSTTGISLLAKQPNSWYSIPRVGVDYFVADSVSVGGAIGFYVTSASGKYEAMGTTTETDIGSGTGYVVAPRVGYALGVTENIALWPRLGITYAHASFSNDDEAAADFEFNESALAISLDVPLVLIPAEHVAFTIAPTIDFGVGGSSELTLESDELYDDDARTTDFGLQAGMTMYF